MDFVYGSINQNHARVYPKRPLGFLLVRALIDVNLPKEVELVVEKWPGLINSGRGEVLAFGRGCLPRIPIFGVFS